MKALVPMDLLVWAGIAACLTQSAIFSGLNLAVFGVTRLRLDIEAAAGSAPAQALLALRKDGNFLLTTILWGNVGVNTLLALLSSSVMTGVGAFVFSTVVITFGGEIIPQSYFSRHALRMAALLAPVLRFYQLALYPVAKPSAMILDAWLGQEGVQYFSEEDFHELIRRHVSAEEADIDHMEGIGALNFLAIDDITASAEGQPVDPESVIELPMRDTLPVFPDFAATPDDPFIRRVDASGKKWVILTDLTGTPCFALDADAFLRDVVLRRTQVDGRAYCHRPIVVEDGKTPLGEIMHLLEYSAARRSAEVIDKDIILVWGKEKLVITGADLLGRLLRGVACHNRPSTARPDESGPPNQAGAKTESG